MLLSPSELRTRYSRLVFQDFSWELTTDGLKVEWHYVLDPGEKFTTVMEIGGITAAQLKQVPETELRQLLFQLGCADLVTYWKLSCPPVIEIAAGWLSADQIAWWNELVLNGLGEFFYVNQINFTEPDFLRWEVTATEPPAASQTPPWYQADLSSYRSGPLAEHVLVPMGGGKDSAVTLEIARPRTKATALLIKPNPASRDLTELSGVPAILVKRQIDPRVAELNKAGYLDGHVPVSSIFAWISVVVGRLTGIPQVLISNERSSNEGNVEFFDQQINHQYSKTFTFENHFQQYVHALGQGKWPFYFSFMRPLYELQIARLFVHQSQHGTDRALSLFLSCNRGQKANVWCGECPKCLFAYGILSPWLPAAQVEQIFGQDLWQNPSLIEIALELVGAREQKPMECVGTREESTVTFWLVAEKYRRLGQELPLVLAAVEKEHLVHQSNMPARTAALLEDWNDEHHLPQAWEELLRQAIIASQEVRPL